MKVLVIACSLNSDSRSAQLAAAVGKALAEQGVAVEAVDLREYELPLCDAGAAYGHEHVEPLRRAVAEADAVLLAVPIYNYDVNAAAKNLVELTGKAWLGKVVGFLCAAGGRGSFMSVMGLANSLMLDFRCLILPRFVYATGVDFDEDGTPNPVVRERVAELAQETVRVAGALAAAPNAARASKTLG
ncbi:MAG: NADPH-dependent oxidoreductase [Planctomycetes bacterium]|jgi:FMN reductase|nr:NADPH-dependent oxidoreductase [Planctomycetota bacterium]